MTLAAAGEGMLPSTDEPRFRELGRMTEANDTVDRYRAGFAPGTTEPKCDENADL
jgi:hypothetical protein